MRKYSIKLWGEKNLGKIKIYHEDNNMLSYAHIRIGIAAHYGVPPQFITFHRITNGVAHG